ncbi:hypothetical protein N657DRAFT_642489 [Parathielavia appendiculata]|uniref:Uncharacterized protein n=1 Tax=Parathielavia appendiculata TaxID=2587402 RepID=A0AAN6U3E8_9PEZI|nr:hypothetical protein N657DRAFT_642489 [Parathielavia appendiculata]
MPTSGAHAHRIRNVYITRPGLPLRNKRVFIAEGDDGERSEHQIQEMWLSTTVIHPSVMSYELMKVNSGMLEFLKWDKFSMLLCIN